jgi:uncharacterized protein YjeT (DUF2065 family)
MRAFGLLLIILGIVAFAIPAYRSAMPRLPLGDGDLRLIGGALFVLGGFSLWFTRER